MYPFSSNGTDGISVQNETTMDYISSYGLPLFYYRLLEDTLRHVSFTSYLVGVNLSQRERVSIYNV